MNKMPEVDFLVIGGGVIGVTVARALALKKMGSVAILEQESSLGRHASGRNSGVIHSGINQKPGSLKAKMCVEGNRRLREFCKRKRVAMNECGTLVAAVKPQDSNVLQELLSRGEKCGVEGLRILTRNEFKTIEPSAEALEALLSPEGATVDSVGLLNALAEEVKDLGVRFYFDSRVDRLVENGAICGDFFFSGKYVINCGGLEADRLAHSVGVGTQYRIIPFRGEYMEVTGCDVRSMIYQAPDLRFPFLSIHLTRECDGRVLAGPSAVLSLGRYSYEKELDWKDFSQMLFSRQFWSLILKPSFIQLAYENIKTSLSSESFLKEIRKLVPSIKSHQLRPARSGIRAQVVDSRGEMVQDLLLLHHEKSTHLLNVVSPGMTSSLPFADYIVAEIGKRL